MVRTTHVSGLLTDLAVLTGQWLRRRPVQGWRAAFPGSIIGGFATGGVLGALAARRGGPGVLLAPAALCAIGGLSYWAFAAAERRRRLRRRATRWARRPATAERAPPSRAGQADVPS